MSVAVIFALNAELKPFLKQAKNSSLLLCRTGIGMGNAHEACERLIEQSAPTLIVSAGYCGGLRPGMKSGDLLLPTEIWSEAGDRFTPEATSLSLPHHSGPLLTVFNLLKTVTEKTVWGNKGAYGVDMETAAIAAVCHKKGVPLISLRVVFDPVTMELPGLTVGAILKKSWLQIPRLIRMNLICQKNLALLLNRFLQTSRPGDRCHAGSGSREG